MFSPNDPIPDPTDLFVNEQLINALEALAEAQCMCQHIGATGMADDLHGPIKELEEMLAWSQSHRGWHTDDGDPAERTTEWYRQS